MTCIIISLAFKMQDVIQASKRCPNERDMLITDWSLSCSNRRHRLLNFVGLPQFTVITDLEGSLEIIRNIMETGVWCLLCSQR